MAGQNLLEFRGNEVHILDHKNSYHALHCTFVYTADGPRAGRFSLSCGFLEGQGIYEIARDGPKDQFVARGQSKTGNPMMLVVGHPAGFPARL